MDPVSTNHLNNILGKTEHAFNVLGWVPVLSSASGAIRIIAGKVQLVAALALAFFQKISGLIFQKKSYIELSNHSFDYVKHGIANICRGYLETIPLIGNVSLFVYDLLPDSRMKYEEENPLFTPSRELRFKILVN